MALWPRSSRSSVLLKYLFYQCPRCGCVSPDTVQPITAAVCPGKHYIQSGRRHYSTDDTNASANRRMSVLNIQMLSKALHKQIFGTEPEISEDAAKQSHEHLKEHGLWGKSGSVLSDVDVQLPPLMGNDIDEHFQTIAEMQSRPYLELAEMLAECTLPLMPRKWKFEAGWTKYEGENPSKLVATKVDCPDDDALVLDVEVCVPESQRPILATAVSGKCWYSWVSKRLVSNEEDFYGDVQRRTVLDDLIPLETREGSMEPILGSWLQRLVVGHNVSYDRSKVKEQYLIKGPRTKFLDTLSLHTCVAGQTTNQKVLWKSREGWRNVANPCDTSWMGVSSPNSLVDVHWLHVGAERGGEMISKEKRDVFVKGTVQDVRKQFQSLMKYCAEDVLHAHEILQKVLPLFLERCPHPVTMAGMLEMGGAYLPVDSSWEQYIADAEYTYEDMEWEGKKKLMALADDACKYMHSNRHESDPWLCNLDWSSKRFRGKAMTKTQMKQLLKRMEERWQQKEQVFRAGIKETVAGDEEEKYEFLIASKDPALPKRPVHMPGYPEWYRNLCVKRTEEKYLPGSVKISPQMRVVPYLLRMKYEGHPLHHHPRLGWGYIVSSELGRGELISGEEGQSSSLQLSVDPGLAAMEELMERDDWSRIGDVSLEDLSAIGYHGDEDGKPCDVVEGPMIELERKNTERVKLSEDWKPKQVQTEFGRTDDIVSLGNGERSYYFFKLPHKNGAKANCGNPLSKDYLHKMENGTLTSAAGLAGQRILTLNSMVSFWRSARNRILDQFVVWLKDNSSDTAGKAGIGAIIPQVRVAGTATRRAVESTWLTASNAKESRVGSELKAMVRAPPGYHIVGADVDSQELWIASVLGDMQFAGIHGCTAIGWMTIQGKKADGTDVHSKTASTIGISRDHAKILTYGRIYGAGLPFIQLLLEQFNPTLSAKQIESQAAIFYGATKGTRVLQLTREGVDLARKYRIPWSNEVVEGYIERKDWYKLRNKLRFTEEADPKAICKSVWARGSESHLFNKLESIATSEHAQTPVLGCHISKALEKTAVGKDFVTTKVNWVVQSSAVDYLHLLLVCMRWLLDVYDIDGRFCISIHDEVRYLVKSEDRYRAALALQFTNLFTRSMFAYKLNMNDLPQSVAFFSAVDIDTVLRKEANMDCKTPSNPHGLEKGHHIPHGEVLDIYEILEKTNSSLNK